MEEPIDKRCGEIFLTLFGNTIFFCSLCEKKFIIYEDFFKHLNNQHSLDIHKEFKTINLTDYESTYHIFHNEEHNIDDNGVAEDIKPLEFIGTVEDSEICQKPDIDKLDTDVLEVADTMNVLPKVTSKAEEEHSSDSILLLNKVKKIKHECPHCNEFFEDRLSYRRHIRTHSTNKSHKCTDCDMAFHTRHELGNHARVHTGERRFPCKICEKSFISSGGRNCHQKRHHEILERKFQCTECNYTCLDPSNFRRHKIRHHGGVKKYDCTQCEKTFYTRNELNTHASIHSEERPFLCTNCGKTFKTSSLYKQHVRRHTSDLLPKKKPKYPCTICDFVCSDPSNLRRHRQRHLGKPFKCDKCDRAFYTRYELNNHVRSRHENTVNEGNDCKTEVRNINSLNNDLLDNIEVVLTTVFEKYDINSQDEIKAYSNDQEFTSLLPRRSICKAIKNRKYKCPICGYLGADRSNTLAHIKRHSKNKPHKCTECEKAFFTRTELNTHIRAHTGECPFLCTICGNTFKTSSKLQFHNKRHENKRDKECPICKKKFFDSTKLREHLPVHSENRAFQCSECKASFKRRVNLTNHMKLHENKLSYQCSLCESKFNQHAGLYSHMKTNHGTVSKATKTGTP